MKSEKETIWQVILNPHAGGGRGKRDKDKILSLLKKNNIQFQLYESEYPGHTIKLASEIASMGFSRFIIAGGDGSLNEAVNGIFNAENKSSEEVIIGMVPVGTGNDWIKTFGIPDHYEKAIKIILEGKSILQDVGEINYTNHGDTKKRFFVNIAGFGFDALVARKANALKLKGVTGIRVYIQSLLSGYFDYRSCRTQITLDGKTITENLFSASVGIGKFNGGGMMQVPDANPLKGEFHITVIRKIGIWGILTNFKGLYTGKFIKDHRVSTHVAKKVEISADHPLSGEADGETLGAGFFKLKIIAHRLRVIYGSDQYLQ